MSDSDQYRLKWKGRQSGPFSVSQIRSQLEQREISLMHEVFCEGEWVTLRVFLQRIETAPAGPSLPSPQRGPVEAAKHPELPQANPDRVILPDPDIARSQQAEGIGQSRGTTISRLPERESGSPIPPPAALGDEPAQLENPGATSGSFFYAGFWMRCGALLFDAAIVGLIVFGLRFLGVFDSITLPHTRTEVGAFMFGMISENLLATISFLILLWLYFALFEGSRLQATPGKRIIGLKVIQSTGRPLNFAGASRRFAGKLLSGALLCWGFFLAAFTERRQALHDVLADTLVVGTPPGPHTIHPLTSASL